MAGAFDMDDLDDFDEIESPTDCPTASRLVASAVYFEQAAKTNIHWYHPGREAWLVQSDDTWKGWSSTSVARTEEPGDWTPWSQILDDSDAPFYRWYTDALTNAAFNEVDRHVLEGHGDELAYVEEADPMIKGDECSETSRHELFVRSAAASHLLRTKFGLQQGDRVIFFLPAGHEQIAWVEACKRMGVIYCCCNPGLPPEQIADRVYALRAKAVITAEHPEWSYVVHTALNHYVPLEDALECAAKMPGWEKADLAHLFANRHTVSLKESPFKESGVDTTFGSVLLGARVIILGAVKVLGDRAWWHRLESQV